MFEKLFKHLLFEIILKLSRFINIEKKNKKFIIYKNKECKHRYKIPLFNFESK